MSLPLTKLGKDVFAGTNAAGNPRQVDNGEAVVWATEIERTIAAAFGVTTSIQGGWDASAGTFPGGGTAAKGDTWIATTAGTVNGVAFGVGDMVVAIATNASTMIYAANWVRFAAVLDPVVSATDSGAGTANAIQATAGSRVSSGGGQLISFVVYEANTATAVTLTITDSEGASVGPLTIKTASGNAPVVGGLSAGLPVMGQIVGSEFRMLSDQASAAIQAAAENAAQEAAGYADLAKNNWVVDTFVGDGTDAPLTLTASPGTVNNCIVTIEGEGPQPRHIFRLEDGTDLYPPSGAVWPNGKQIEVAYGNAIEVEVGTPTDGSVTAPKIGSGAVTRTKVANDAINADKLASDPGELAAIAAKIGVQPAKLLNISLVRDTATYSTTATTLGEQGNVSQNFAASSPTSSLLVLVFFRLEMARDSTAGSTGMAVEPNHYTGTAYSASGELIEILDTDGPISQILRAGASGAIVLTAAQKRSDLPSDNGMWTVLNYFRSNNAQCTAKIIRQTFVFVEFEP